MASTPPSPRPKTAVEREKEAMIESLRKNQTEVPVGEKKTEVNASQQESTYGQNYTRETLNLPGEAAKQADVLRKTPSPSPSPSPDLNSMSMSDLLAKVKAGDQDAAQVYLKRQKEGK